MKTASKLAFSLLTLSLAGGAAYAAADQTVPGAAHGANNAGPATPHAPPSDKSDNIGAGQTGAGGTANGNSAAGPGTQPGAGGMQPRMDKSDGDASTHGRSTSGNAQGF